MMSDQDMPPVDSAGDEVTPDGMPHVVPDKVLEELLVAFSEPEPSTDFTGKDTAKGYDFDDPSIDRLLGLTPQSPADDVEAPNSTEDDEFVDEGDDSMITVVPVSADPAAATAPRPVIFIADDDQPDALYLDEAGEQRLRDTHGDDSGGRSTIVISDLDETGTVEALPARSQGTMDPRVRARRIAVRRAEGRRRLLWAGIALGVLLVAVGVLAVCASRLFDVRTIQVQGNVYTSPAQLQAVEDSLRGHPILLVDTRKAERELEAIPWVESATVRTDFPHRVTIDIRERRALATFAGSDGGFRVIDRDGRVLDVVTSGRPLAYMLLTGSAPDTQAGQFAGAPYAAAAQLVIALPPEIRSITDSVGVDANANTLQMHLTGPAGVPVLVNLGAPTDLESKLALLLTVVRQGLAHITTIDAATPGQISTR